VSTIPVRASSNGRGSDAWADSWTHFRIDRRSPGYCRVTFDHPPINTITATTVAELAELVGLIEQDRDLVRLSRAPVVTIASIRGSVRGAGREFVLACDLRFADYVDPDA
jgi:enoyl-CoA hydratase/carnithine racemase